MMQALDSVPRIATLSADDERYQVRGTLEIAGIMRRLMAQRSLVTAHASDHATFFVTALLAIDEAHPSLIFDYGVDAALTGRMLRGGRITFVTQLDHVRIQFSTDAAEAIDFEGGPACRVPMPRALTRLQRREFYRLRIPRGRPLVCDVPVPVGVEAHAASSRAPLNVYDVSCGGLALSGWPASFVPNVGLDLPGTTIELPDLGRIVVDLRVVHVQGGGLPGQPGGRFGCRFVSPHASIVSLVQRHINRIEREQRALS